MRADRLLATMMLLQTRGRMTARELAERLEVSVRTIYRDLEALSTAGVPVYTESGPGGGCALLDSYRTDLTGLTDEEVRALFILSIPSVLTSLGLGHELRSALLKLSAALPDARRAEEARVRQRIYLDWSPTAVPDAELPHLGTLQRAVWDDRKLALTLSSMYGAPIQQVVAPYGLVALGGKWHLVCAHDGAVRAVAVGRVLEAEVLAEGFARPEGFDLAKWWEAWRALAARNRPRYDVHLRVTPAYAKLLPFFLGERAREVLAVAEGPDAEGRLILTLTFERLDVAREKILGWGRAVEVLAPEALRRSVADYATQIAGLYVG